MGCGWGGWRGSALCACGGGGAVAAPATFGGVHVGNGALCGMMSHEIPRPCVTQYSVHGWDVLRPMRLQMCFALISVVA